MTRECERCGSGYDEYIVLLRDNFSDIVQYARCEWDNLCKPCRYEVADYGAFLTESELEELESGDEKNGVEDDD